MGVGGCFLGREGDGKEGKGGEGEKEGGMVFGLVARRGKPDGIAKLLLFLSFAWLLCSEYLTAVESRHLGTKGGQ